MTSNDFLLLSFRSFHRWVDSDGWKCFFDWRFVPDVCRMQVLIRKTNWIKSSWRLSWRLDLASRDCCCDRPVSGISFFRLRHSSKLSGWGYIFMNFLRCIYWFLYTYILRSTVYLGSSTSSGFCDNKDTGISVFVVVIDSYSFIKAAICFGKTFFVHSVLRHSSILC